MLGGIGIVNSYRRSVFGVCYHRLLLIILCRGHVECLLMPINQDHWDLCQDSTEDHQVRHCQVQHHLLCVPVPLYWVILLCTEGRSDHH